MNARKDPHGDTGDTAQVLQAALRRQAETVRTDPAALQRIQRRTSQGAPQRRWLLAAGGAAVATAAVITTVAVIGESGRPPVVQPADQGQDDGFYDPDAAAERQLPVYYVGPQPAGQGLTARLYAEPHTVDEVPADPALTAVQEFFTSRPIDRDYSRGFWSDGVDVSGITSRDGLTTIDLTGRRSFVRDGIDAQRAKPAIQAVARTAGLTPGTSFTFTANGDSLSSLGPVDLPATVSPDDVSRALISIDNIVDGQTVSSPVTVQVSGNVFEGNVNWELWDSSRREVDEGYVTTSMGSWTQAAIRLGRLEPGTYTIRCLEYSAKDGSVINVDDKVFTVE